MTTKDDIIKLGFTNHSVFVTHKNGKTASLHFKDFPRLESATKEQRQNYTVSPFGIHWEELDEDLSFDGFFNYTSEGTKDRISKIIKFSKTHLEDFL